ncbi:MAG: 7-carboxy-7-deazaguanine synthase QueE [Cyclobacteriaceae bacterium]|nr:7-carboxy-7-deazaguanine synthase QueE [Cyclobacteriaceae bacterium]
METFYSIQGEGYHTGKSAFFIRLSGCDIGCSWCDVKESWDIENSSLKSVKELVFEAVSHNAKRVIITGGEPTMYDLAPLTSALQTAGIQTHLETSGVYKITGDWDWVCISPKKFKAPLRSEMQKADELKIVVVNKSDYSWAQEYAQNVEANCKLFLQPEWEKSSNVIDGINEYVKNYPEWRISLQTHKYMNIR